MAYRHEIDFNETNMLKRMYVCRSHAFSFEKANDSRRVKQSVTVAHAKGETKAEAEGESPRLDRVHK